MSLPISNPPITTQASSKHQINSAQIKNNSTNSPSFKGTWTKSEDGTPYLKTHSGLLLGGIMTGVAALFKGFGLACGEACENINKTLGVVDNEISKGKKQIAISMALAAAIHLGCGAIVDMVRNNQAKKAAQQNNQKMLQNEQDNKSQNSNKPNYISNVGLKLGALLGAGAGLISIGTLKLVNKGQKLGMGAVITSLALNTLGGLLLGKCSDSMANKDYRRNNLL